eukprot:12456854-Alexandrium_andersonii.AAC.1
MAFSACLQQDLIGQRHRFQNVVVETAARCFDAKLPKEAYSPQRKHMSFDYSGIQSTSASPSWYSPSAQNLPVSWYDLSLLRDAAGDFAK